MITQKNVIAAEIITDALYSQDKYGDPFVQSLVGGGHITEWDLAKLVAENFQLPFLMASNYDISEQAVKRIPTKYLFENQLVPLDVFDDVVCIVMPILTPYAALAKIQREVKCDLFPYVGLISENKKVLGDLYKDFTAWSEQDQKRREKAATLRANKKDVATDWMSIFDAGDEAIQQGLGTPKPQVNPLLGGGKKKKKTPKNLF